MSSKQIQFSINEKFVKEGLQRKSDKSIFSCVTLPSGCTFNGIDLSGYQLYPKNLADHDAITVSETNPHNRIINLDSSSILSLSKDSDKVSITPDQLKQVIIDEKKQFTKDHFGYFNIFKNMEHIAKDGTKDYEYIEIPKGVEINGKDVSYYRFSVDCNQVKDCIFDSEKPKEKQRRTVRFSKDRPILLRKSVKEEGSDTYSELPSVKTTGAELDAAIHQMYKNYNEENPASKDIKQDHEKAKVQESRRIQPPTKDVAIKQPQR